MKMRTTDKRFPIASLTRLHAHRLWYDVSRAAVEPQKLKKNDGFKELFWKILKLGKLWSFVELPFGSGKIPYREMRP